MSMSYSYTRHSKNPDPIVWSYDTPKEKFKHVIGIGKNVDIKKENSVIVCHNPVFIDPNNNINFANVLEANSDTGSVSLRGDLHVRGQLLTPIKKCQICLRETNLNGIEWQEVNHIRSMCWNCIFDSAMYFRAQQQWNERVNENTKVSDTNDINNTNVIIELKKEMRQLKEEIQKLKENS